MVPLVAAGALMAGGSLLSGWLGSNAQKDAAKKQEKQNREYMEMMLKINSPEYRFTPEQLGAQSKLPTLYQAMISQATGSQYGDTVADLTAKRDSLATELQKLLEKQTAVRGNSWRQRELAEINANVEAKQREFDAANQGIQGSNEGSALYGAMRNAYQGNLNTARGNEQSAQGIGLQNAQRALMENGRAMTGNATSGHVLGQMGDLQQAAIPLRSQLSGKYDQSMRDWQSGIAQQGLASLQSYALGQPLGGSSFTPQQQAAPTADMTWANLAGQLGSLGSTYALYNGLGAGKQNLIPTART